MTARLALTVTLALLLAAPSIWAQDGVIVGRRFVGATRHFGADLGPVPEDLTWPLIGGGRFAVRETADLRDILDRRTGATVALPANSVVLALDPTRPRVFVVVYSFSPVTTAVVAAFDAAAGTLTHLVSLPSCCIVARSAVSNDTIPVDPSSSQDIARYAVDADVLFVVTSGPATPARTIAVVDATTGAHRAPALVIHSNGWGNWWDVTPDGAALFTATHVDSTGTLRGLTRVNVATGQIEASTAVGAFSVRWHPSLEALVADNARGFDRQLQPLGAVQGAEGFCEPVLEVSPHTGRIYVKTGGGSTTYRRFPEMLTAIDPSTGGWTSVNLDVTLGLGGSGCPFGLTVLSAPGAPRNLFASVAGRDVALHWESIGAASHFVLDVGFAPGRTDASVFLGPDSHAAFGSVPPGTYYLRLRGGNEFGGGRASNEIQLVVP